MRCGYNDEKQIILSGCSIGLTGKRKKEDIILAEKLQISLAAARVNAGLTQEDVAKTMHVGKQTIGNWEKGKSVVKPAQFEFLCKLYNISQDNIFLPKIYT